MAEPKRRKRLSPEQKRSYAVLRDLREEVIRSIATFNRMLKANNAEILEHLDKFNDDPRVRASDGITAVDGVYKLPMALYTRASIKSLLDSLVVLDQRLEVFEGTQDEAEEQETERKRGRSVAASLLAQMDARAEEAAREAPGRPGSGALAGQDEEETDE